MTSLLERLARDLLTWMVTASDGVPRRVLLWLDPECGFLRLSTHLGPALEAQGARLLRYDPAAGSGQLSLKLALLRLEAEPEARAVVYLPGFETSDLQPRPDGGLPGLWGVFEYRYKGCVWGRGKGWQPGAVPQPHSLATWLRGHGVTFADERTRRELTKGGVDSLLARYTEAMRGTDPGTWPKPLRSSDVLAALGGDPREHLRTLLAAPANAFRRWREEEVAALALARIGEEFGLVPPEGEWSPEELADAFAVQLALAEAFEAFGEPEDFPYRARLPERAEQRRRAAAFLREELLPHMELGPRFLQRMRRLEKDHPLADWAGDREGQPLGLPLLAEQRLRRLLERLEERAGPDWRAAAELLDPERAAIEAGARLPDDQGARGWATIRDLAELLRIVRELEGKVDAVKGGVDAVRLYAEEGWRVDLLHLRVRAMCARAHGPEVVRRLADLAYFELVSRFADRLFDLVEAEGSWPPAGVPGPGSIREALWSKGRRRKAVVVTDALRLDLAQLVAERLEGEVSLDVLATTLPTNTPFGMAALLPLPEEGPAVSFAGGKASISAGEVAGLETRDGRKAFLLRALGGPKGAGVGFLDLEALLQRQPVPESPLVVVFDNTIDEQGHKGTEQLPLLAEQFADDLRRAILLLHEAGVEEVHVVTDHGFLMLPPELVDGLGRPELLPAQALHKDARWAALKPGAPVQDLLRLPLPLAPEAATLGFPRGVRTLVKAEGYLHGGISPQECVVPHLVSRTEVRVPRLQVEVGVTTERLSTGVVPVVLRPSLEGQLALTELPSVTVRLWVEAPGGAGEEARLVTEPVDVPVRADAGELRPPLYLKEGLELVAGQELLLRAVDRDTGRELGTVALTLVVDWD
jgi:hypothetical protein